MSSTEQQPIPRGRHAPPLEVRLSVQRRRLYDAAADAFARDGYASSSAEAVAREAGMSKATFYEHFANKEECLLALVHEAATEVMRAMAQATGHRDAATSYETWVRDGLRAFLDQLELHPAAARVFLVEVVGAGPRALARRDAILDTFAEAVQRDNARMAPRFGAPTFASRDDAFAAVGGMIEVAARQLRASRSPRMRDAEPALLRLFFGLLTQAEREGLGGR